MNASNKQLCSNLGSSFAWCAGIMVLRSVSAYSSLKRKDKGGKFRTYFPLRAVGLAVESGYKLCQKGGLGLVAKKGLKKVRVAGKLQVLEGGTWEEASAVSLSLRSQDEALAVKLLTKQREFLSDLHFNWFCTDAQRSGSKSLDLVGDFSTKRNFGVTGLVWVEVKAFGKLSFEKRAKRTRTTLRTEFASLQSRDPSFEAVLFLAAECETLGGDWGTPKLKAELLTSADGEWQKLGGRRKAARGQAQGKPSFLNLWGRLQKHTTAEKGQKVRLLKHFLRELRLPHNSTTQRVETYNKLLRAASRTERLVQEKVLELSGSAPVVGTKEVFRELYKLL